MARNALVLFLAVSGWLQSAEPLRVLFIGNSGTYYNTMPEIFAELARAAMPDRKVEVGMAVQGGQTLLSLWEGSEARQMLRSSKWDYVVLQDQSRLGEGLRDGKLVVNSPAMHHWGVRLFDTEIKRAGARNVLLLTWSRRAEPHQQDDLNYAYDSIALELGAILAPVGPAWQRARQESPDVELYAKDGSHPSPAGSYLMACVLVVTLFPELDRDLPAEISGHPFRRGGVDTNRREVLVAMPTEQARSLQNSARAVVLDLKRRGGYLNASPPERPPTTLPEGEAVDASQLAGTWTGELNYFPSPAALDLTLRFEGDKCQGDLVIKLPEGKQQYVAPLWMCSLTGGELRFAVPTLPLPSLLDRFTARMVNGRLAGAVQRTGREVMSSMSGTWSAERTIPAP